MHFFCLLLPSFVMEIVLLSPEGMAENCKAFMFWLQMDKFPLERLLRDLLEREVWVPIPTMFPNTVPQWVPSLRRCWKGAGEPHGCLGEKKRFHFIAPLRLRKLRLKSSVSREGAMTSSPAFLLKLANSISKNK